MGKDNVYFHTVFWPSILLGDGRPWTTLHHLSTTGTQLLRRVKKYGCDAHRFMHRVPELRIRQVLQVKKHWSIWPWSQGDWYSSRSMAVLSFSFSARNFRLHVLMGRFCEYTETSLFACMLITCALDRREQQRAFEEVSHGSLICLLNTNIAFVALEILSTE
jgi:hypothetical protein